MRRGRIREGVGIVGKWIKKKYLAVEIHYDVFTVDNEGEEYNMFLIICYKIL